MNWHLIASTQTAANCTLAIALLLGGALLARRSLAAATWMAIAGFGQAGFEITYRMMSSRSFAINLHASPEMFFAFWQWIFVFKAVFVFGAVALAVHTLPARSRS